MYIRCADLHIFWCITACGDTQFNVNVHMRKSVFPRTRICTVLSEFPHVEIHKSMCESAPRKYAFPHVEIHINRVFPHVEIHQKLWISQHAEIHIVFPRRKTCGNTRFFADFRMRKYTRICEFPRAEIHPERCITACGNTLNQVQKNSSTHGGNLLRLTNSFSEKLFDAHLRGSWLVHYVHCR